MPMPANAPIPLKDAADQFGVSLDTLRRRQKAGELPEAELVPGQSGDQWVLPEHALAPVAQRNGWVIDLRSDAEAVADASIGTMPKHKPVVEGEVLEAKVALAKAEAKTESDHQEIDRQKAKIRQLEGDLEHERVERERLSSDLGRVSADLAVSSALVGERGELVSRLEEVGVVQGERVVGLTERAVRAEAEAEALRGSLGWFGRRRLAKIRVDGA